MMSGLSRLWPLIILVATAPAQEITGAIVGSIYDISGHALAAATIQVINSDRNQAVRSLHADASGSYSALLLPVGSYQVIARAPGHESSRVTDVQVDVGSRTTCVIN